MSAQRGPVATSVARRGSGAVGGSLPTVVAARRRGNARKRLELALLLGPALVLFFGFVVASIVVAVYYSLFQWSGFGPLDHFIAFKNYQRVLTDPVFLGAIEHNLILAGLAVVVQIPLATALALLLNRRMRGRAFLRLVAFAPYVLAAPTTAVMWSLMLQPDGFVDQLMNGLGLGGLVQTWLADRSIVLYTLFVVITWQYLGFGIVLLLAGLQGIPAELREAAALDGATAWQTTRHVVLPLLGPTVRILAFLSIVGSLQLFDLVWIMTLGGPANASTTMATYLIDYGFKRYQFGYGSAAVVVMFAICFVFALLYQRFVMRRDTQDDVTRMAG